MHTGRSLPDKSKGNLVLPSTSHPIIEQSPSYHFSYSLTTRFVCEWIETVRPAKGDWLLLSYFLASHFFSTNFSKGGWDSYFFLSGDS